MSSIFQVHCKTHKIHNHIYSSHPSSKVQFSSVLFSCSVISDSLQPHGLHYARCLCPSPTPGACSNSCSSSQWCHPTISSSVIPFSHLQSFSASGSFPVSQFFISGGQSIGVSASTSVLPMNIQDGFSLELAGSISLLSKGLSRVFSNTNKVRTTCQIKRVRLQELLIHSKVVVRRSWFQEQVASLDSWYRELFLDVVRGVCCW